jgi:anti-anti-sigma factor
MESDAFHLTRKADPAGEIVLAAEGYLDDAGGAQLKREADAALAAGQSRLRIDLEAVALFNCAGARRLLAALDDLERGGKRVRLVGVRPPLKRALGCIASDGC